MRKNSCARYLSYPTLKRALMDLKRQRKVRCLGKGRDDGWERIGS